MTTSDPTNFNFVIVSVCIYAIGLLGTAWLLKDEFRFVKFCQLHDPVELNSTFCKAVIWLKRTLIISWCLLFGEVIYLFSHFLTS